MRRVHSILSLLLLVAAGNLAFAAEAPKGQAISIENEFIRIRVNAGSRETGRFAVDTTGGDPARAADDGKVLIYGSREPWTSYTTMLVDGTSWVFGGASDRRAGKGATATLLVTAPKETDGRIETVARAAGVEVQQRLGFGRNPTTRVNDAALISYTLTNRGNGPAMVGLRIVVDTMLGSNDAAPLRAGERSISTATQLNGSAIPDYWQAFDSLSQPAVVSQGTLRGPGLTPPDRLEMVDWGTLAEAPWSYQFPAGADFTRHGEEAQDTAVALYWNPEALAPGASRTYTTMYGVGGISLSPAQLSLGLTAPAEVDFIYDDTKPFTVIGYLENSGGFASRQTKLALELSEGLKLEEGAAVVDIGLLQPGQTKQAVWRVVPTGRATGTLQLTATAISENLEPNRVARDIIVNSPPQLVVTVTAPARLSVTKENRYSPNPFPVKVEVANRGAQPARNLAVTLNPPEGLTLAKAAEATKLAERIDATKAVSFTWPVQALGLPAGELTLTAKATAAGAKSATGKAVVVVPKLTPELRVYPAKQTVPALTDGEPTLIPVAVKLVPARDFTGAKVSVGYDPAIVEPLYLSRGDAFVESGKLLSPWSAGKTTPGLITDIGGERTGAPAINAAELTLFTVVFLVKDIGQTGLAVEASAMKSAGGIADLRVVNGSITVEATE